jgi:hypothetical protein
VVQVLGAEWHTYDMEIKVVVASRPIDRLFAC